jgi:hypothetical protein
VLGCEDQKTGVLIFSKEMGAFIYRCPTTALNVQAWFAEEVADDDV